MSRKQIDYDDDRVWFWCCVRHYAFMLYNIIVLGACCAVFWRLFA